MLVRETAGAPQTASTRISGRIIHPVFVIVVLRARSPDRSPVQTAKRDCRPATSPGIRYRDARVCLRDVCRSRSRGAVRIMRSASDLPAGQAVQLSFGPFRLDEEDGSLWRAGERLAMTRKALQVLAHVAARAGRLVTKEELLRAVWPDTHVSDAALRVSVLEVRKVLGDRQRGARYLETVHGRGYRFVAPVRREGRGPIGPSSDIRPAEVPHDPPVVGRHDVLGRLRDLLGQAQRGARQTVFVTGEAGIGKTTVVETFVSRLDATATHVARGQCVEHHGLAEAYMPVLEALARLCRGPRGAAIIEVLRAQAPTWLVEMPWLVSPSDRALLQREILGATRERMLRELAEAIETLTADTPLVLVLEDLHWSDSATVDVVAMLARRPEPAQLLLLGTYRPADLITNAHPLVAVVQELTADRRCTEIPLALLTSDEVEQFLRLQLGEEPVPSELVDAIYARTEGNPLFMVNVVEEILARGGSAAPLQIEVPANVRGMIEKQLRRLDDQQRQILEAASVAGVEFRPGAVAAALAQDVDVVEQHCAALASGHLFLRPAARLELPGGSWGAR